MRSHIIIAIILYTIISLVSITYGEDVSTQGTLGSQCTAVSPSTGLGNQIGGYFQSFSIQARNNAGGLINAGGDKFKVQLTNPTATLTGSVVDFGNGTYSVRYASYNPGAYNLNVLLTGPKPSPYSILFGNGNNRIALGTPSILQPTQFTISTYFRTSSTANMILFRWEQNGYGMKIENGIPECLVWLTGSGFQRLIGGSTSFADDKWHHIACTFNNVRLSIFLDGAEVNRQTSVGQISYANPASCNIGSSGDTLHYSGYLDDVRVYNHSRSQRQIQDSMLQVALPTDFGLLANWNFDIDAGTTVIDNVGNVNGTRIGDFLLQTTTPTTDFAVGAHISGSPFSINVLSQPSQVYGPGLGKGLPGLNKQFTIQSTDRFGANETVGGSTYSVVMVPTRHHNANITATVTDNNNGTYTVQYDANFRAVFETNIKRVGPSENRYALSLDGVNDYVWLGYDQAMQVSRITVEVWFKSTMTGKGTMLSWFKNGYRMYLDSGKVKFVMYDELSSAQTVTSPLNYNDGNWHHAVATFSGTHLTLYMEGVQVAQLVSTFNVIYFPNAGATLGRQEDSLDYAYFKGQIDELRIWNIARTAQEVSDTRLTHAKGDETGLVAYWNFDEGVGTSIQDVGPAGITGDIRNGGTYDGNTTKLNIYDPPGISGSPFVTMLNYPTKGSQSFANMTTGTAGAASSFLITAADFQGVYRDFGGDTFSVVITAQSVTSGTTFTLPNTITDLDNGQYRVNYNATLAGVYSVAATYPKDGETLSGSPYTLNVISGPASTNSVLMVSGASPISMVAGTINQQLLVQAVDAFGNNKSAAGDTFALQLTGPVAPIVSAITYQSNGIYRVSFNVTTSGSYAANVRISGAQVQNSPVSGITVVAAITHAPMAIISPNPVGVTLVAGTYYNVSFISRDAFGNQRPSGGDSWQSLLKPTGGGANVAGSLIDLGNGQYVSTVRPTLVGSYTWQATLNQVMLGQSGSLTVNVTVAPVDDRNAAFSGISGVNFEAGKTNSFSLVGRDQFGNSVTGISANYTVSIAGTTFSYTGIATFGSVSLMHNITLAGNYQVTGTFAGYPIANSPSTMRVVPTVRDPARCFAYGSGLTVTGETGGAVQFTIQSVDTYGNNRTSGGDSFAGTVTGLQNTTVSITDQSNGMYSGTYNVTAVGTYVVALESVLAGPNVPVVNSPFTVSIVASIPHPGSSFISGMATSVVAGVGDSFNMTVLDAFGNPDDKPESFVVSFSGGSGSATFIASGVYTVDLNMTVSGNFSVSVKFQGTSHVQGSPYSVQVLPQPSITASQSTVANFASVVPAGDINTFMVQPRDAFGNNVTLTANVANIQVSVSGNVPAIVQTINGNAYQATWNTTVVANYTVNVNLLGAPIKNSPFMVSVVAASITSYPLSYAIVNDQTVGTMQLDIVSTDQYGNLRTSGGDNYTVAINAAGYAKSLTNIQDLNNGKYRVSFEATVAQTYTISVFGADGSTSVKNSPYTLNAIPDIISSKSTLSGVGASRVASLISNITLIGRDKYNNLLTAGGSSSLIALVTTSSTGVQQTAAGVTVDDLGNGKYTLRLRSTIVGTTSLAVTVNGTQVTGSPVQFTTQPSAIAATSIAIPAAATMVAGSNFNILVIGRDAFGNRLTSGGDIVQASIFHNTNGAVNLTDASNGNYSMVYTTNVAGQASFTLRAMVAGQFVTVENGQFTVTVQPSSAVGSQSLITGATSWTAGESAVLFLQPRDQFGNNRTSEGGSPTVTFTPAVFSSSVAFDTNMHLYRVNFEGRVAQTYSVVATMAGTNTPGFAFTVVPTSVIVNAQYTTTPSNIQANQSSTVLVVLKDTFNNVMVGSTGSGALSARFVPTSGSQTIAYNGTSGHYRVQYSTTVAGTYSLQILGAGGVLTGSAQNIVVSPLAGVASTSTAAGVGLTNVIVGHEAEFQLTVRDTFGNHPTSNPTGSVVSVSFSPANAINSSSVTTLGGSKYSIKYNATKQGPVNITVFVDNIAVANTPFTVNVAAQAFTFGPNSAVISSTGLVAGAQASLIVQSRDTFGNNINISTDVFTATFANNNGAGNGVAVNSSYVAGTVGQHRIVFSTTIAGNYTTSILFMGNTPIQDSPMTFEIVAAALDASKSTVVSSTASVTAGGASVVVVQTRDAYGNQRVGTTDVVASQFSGAAMLNGGSSVPLGNGMYRMQTSLTVAGTYSVAITAGGSAIGGSPLTVTVNPTALDLNNAYVFGAIISDQQATAGLVNQAMVQLTDTFNNTNPINAALVNVNATVNATFLVNLQIVYVSNGLFRISFDPRSPGQMEITITADGQTLINKLPVIVVGGNLVPVQSAQFSNTGYQLSISFSSATNLGGMTVATAGSCDTVFDQTTLTALGNGVECIWDADNAMRVLLGGSFSLRPGNPIVFKQSGIGLATGNKTLVATSITVNGPGTVPQPQITIVGPSSAVGRCDDVYLSTSLLSTSTSGPISSYTWKVSSNEPNATRVAAVQTFLDGINSATVTITSNLPTAGYVWLFEVRAINVFGAASPWAAVNVTKSAQDAPTVIILPGASQTVQYSKPISLQAVVNAQGCSGSTQKVAYVWSAKNATQGTLPIIDSVTGNSPMLNVPSSTWSNVGAVYVFSLTVTGASGTSTSTDVTVTVVADPLQAVIDGGDRTQKLSTAVSLNGTLSNPRSRPGFSYVWSCQPASGVGICVDSSNNSIAAALAMQNATGTASVSLGSAGQYRFSLTVNGDGLTSSTSVLITLVDTNQPLPELTVMPSAQIVNARQRVVLTATVSSTGNSATSYLWDAWSVPGGALDVTQTANAVVLGSTLVIQTGVLQPGRTYWFRVNGSHPGGNMGTAQTTVQVNASPRGGDVTVSPSNGTSLTTAFTLSAANWIDEENNVPFVYQFFVEQKQADGTVADIPLNAPGALVSISTQLPAGDSAIDYALNVGIKVTDQLGATTRRVRRVYSVAHSSPQNGGNTDLSGQTSQLRAAINAGDCVTIQQWSTALLAELNRQATQSIGTVASRRTLRTEIMAAMVSCFNNTHVNPTSVYGQTVSLQQLLSVPSEIVNNDTTSIIRHIENALSKTEELTSDTPKALVDLVSTLMSLPDWEASPEAYVSVFSSVRTVVHRIGRLILAGRQCGEPAVKLSSSEMDIGSFRLDRTSVQSSTVTVGSAVFGLPDSVFEQAQSVPQCMDGQSVSWRKNPFAWATGSAQVASNVSSLTLLRNDGSELVVSDLLSPLNISFTLSTPPTDTDSTTCEFWDTFKNRWSTSGCKLSEVNGNNAVCLCNHLTDFAVRITPISANIDAKYLPAGPLLQPIPLGCVVIFDSVPVMTAFVWFLLHLAVLLIIYLREKKVQSARQVREASKAESTRMERENIPHHYMLETQGEKIGLVKEFKGAMWYHHAIFGMLQSLSGRMDDTYTEYQREHVATVVIFSIMAAETYLLDSQEMNWFSASGAIEAASIGLFFSLLFALLFQKCDWKEQSNTSNDSKDESPSTFIRLDGFWFAKGSSNVVYAVVYAYLAVCAWIIFWFSRCFSTASVWEGWFATCFAAYAFFILFQEMVKVLLLTLWRQRARKEYAKVKYQALANLGSQDSEENDEEAQTDFSPPGQDQGQGVGDNDDDNDDDDDLAYQELGDGFFGLDMDDGADADLPSLPPQSGEDNSHELEGLEADSVAQPMSGMATGSGSGRTMDLTMTLTTTRPNVQVFNEPKKRKKQGQVMTPRAGQEADLTLGDNTANASRDVDEVLLEFAPPPTDGSDAADDETTTTTVSDMATSVPLSSLGLPSLNDDDAALFSQDVSPHRDDSSFRLPSPLHNEDDDDVELPYRQLHSPVNAGDVLLDLGFGEEEEEWEQDSEEDD